MKKILLLTTLLVGGLLLTGCNKLNSEIDEIRALELAKTKEWRIELCNNKILAEVDSWATNFVWEEVIYSEWDEDSRHSDNFIYFSWSNWEDKVYGCGLGQHWKFINLFPIDQEFLNSEEYQQLGELREMLTEEDIDELVVEEVNTPKIIWDNIPTIESFWIFHNIEEWTIMLDNWEESITIMDKNLWADIAWTWEKSYWYYFQRWNNHGFQLNSEIKTWKDLVTRDVALQYWPDNWYDSDVQLVIMDNSEEVNRNLNLGNYFLAAVNDNLRWWSWDSEIVNRMPEYVIDQFRWDTGNPRTERKWPCPEWFHVPSFGEIHKLFKLWIDIKYPNDIEKKEHVRWMAIWDRWISTEFGNDLLLPRAWWIRFDGKATPHNQWSIWYYWMSSPWRFLRFDNNGIVEYSESYRAATFPIRCFKD